MSADIWVWSGQRDNVDRFHLVVIIIAAFATFQPILTNS